MSFENIESGSFHNKEYNHIDSEPYNIHSEIIENDQEFREFLDYILINVEKFENKIKEAYENIINSYENPEILG